MNSPTGNADSIVRPGDADHTLRIVSNLPAPDGLEDRLMETLKRSHRTTSLLKWPVDVRAHGHWMRSDLARGVAAAAIVLAVCGGSWSVYSRVHPAEAPRMVAMPRVAAPGGFSSAGAMRTPQTLNGPVLARPVNPVAAHAAGSTPGLTSPAKKPRKVAKASGPTKPAQ